MVALGTGGFVISYKHSLNHVSLKPTWKGNLCLLALVAMIVSASIFVVMAKSSPSYPRAADCRQFNVAKLIFAQAEEEPLRKVSGTDSSHCRVIRRAD
jgi:hypothetical protein